MVSEVNTGAPADQVLTGFQISTEAPKLESGDTPLNDFWGTGCGWMVKGGTGKERANADGTITPGRPWQRVHMNWIGLEVISSSEPYPHPTATFSIFYSDPDKSYKARPGQGTNEWDAWCEPMRAMGLEGNQGFDRLFGGMVFQDGQQPANMGMRMHVKRVARMMRVGPNTDAAAQAMQQGDAAEGKRLAGWHDEVREVLSVVEVEGVGTWQGPDAVAAPTMVMPTAVLPSTGAPTNGVVPTAQMQQQPAAPFDLIGYVLGLANGKTVDQFYQAAMDDAVVMANPSLVTQMTGRQFHVTMVGLGKLAVNNGILSVV